MAIGRGLGRNAIKATLAEDPGALTLEIIAMLDRCLAVYDILGKAQDLLDVIKPDNFLSLCTEHAKAYETLLNQTTASHEEIHSQMSPLISGELTYIFHKTKQNETTLRLTTCSVVKDLRVVW